MDEAPLTLRRQLPYMGSCVSAGILAELCLELFGMAGAGQTGAVAQLLHIRWVAVPLLAGFIFGAGLKGFLVASKTVPSLFFLAMVPAASIGAVSKDIPWLQGFAITFLLGAMNAPPFSLPGATAVSPLTGALTKLFAGVGVIIARLLDRDQSRKDWSELRYPALQFFSWVGGFVFARAIPIPTNIDLALASSLLVVEFVAVARQADLQQVLPTEAVADVGPRQRRIHAFGSRRSESAEAEAFADK